MELTASPDMAGLKQFMIRWFGGARPEWGMDPWDVPSYVPEPLAEVYRFAGRWPSNSANDRLPDSPAVFQNQDVLVRVADLVVTDGMVTFLEENQGVWQARVEADNDDSAVWSNADSVWEEAPDRFERLECTLPHLLTTFCLQEITLGSARVWAVYDPQWIETLPLFINAEPIWLNGSYVYARSGDDDQLSHSFWLSNEVLIMMSSGQYWLATNRGALPGINESDAPIHFIR